MKKILSIFGAVITIAILSLVVSFTSCNFDPLEWKAYSNSYVLHYGKLNTIYLYNNRINFNDNEYYIISINTQKGEYIGGFQSKKEEEKAAFEEVCERYGDTFFNRKVTGDRDYTIRFYYANEFTHIDVVSDADFDARHPAGTSLKDIFRFVTLSPLKYIRSGYTDTYDWRDISDLSDQFRAFIALNPEYTTLRELHPVDNMLSEANNDDFKLLGFGDQKDLFSLVLTAKPSSAGIHNITVTLTDTEGQIITCTIGIDFAG